MEDKAVVEGERFTVSGLVQGVGFRPLVWRLARQLQLIGEVCNTAAGVQIDLWGTDQQRQQFIELLYQQLPSLAHIDQLQRQSLAVEPTSNSFDIASSTTGEVTATVVADAASCPQCVAEISDPTNRRYGYAFTHCCHCGPRLSIIKAIPYDRHNTSMVDFPLCAECQREYDDPANRRFHAQPTACASCGPQLLWFDQNGNKVAIESPMATESHITTAVEKLRAGNVVAIKGMGGIHLACDARNSDAIERIRQFKHRPHKALALMAKNLQMVREYASLTEQEAELLGSAAAPVVILPALGRPLPSALAPGQNSLGFMLPYTPLHHLLMAELDFPLVFTSANGRGAPMIIDNSAVLRELNGVADGFLLHNRDIINRVDDSVVRFMDGKARVLRRARGYAPRPLQLPAGFQQSRSVLAMGGQKKNSFTLLQQGRAVMSQYMGELDSVDSCRDYRRNLQFYTDLYQHQPKLIAVDYHDDYFSSHEGRNVAAGRGVPVETVQHHHAHIAALMAEHGLPLDHKPVLGVALDGLGLGENNQLWGGEFLLCDYRTSERLASLQPVAMPGGDRAAREPWRNLLAQLLAIKPWSQWLDQYSHLDIMHQLQQHPIEQLEAMIKGDINSPLASSSGRLFDAVAAALGLCFEQQSYEGQAAIELEALAQNGWIDNADLYYPFDIKEQDGLWRLELSRMWSALLSDLSECQPRELIAARFHCTLIRALTRMVEQLAQGNAFNTVLLSGGVFQNRLLLEGLSETLRSHDCQVFSAQHYPANDGGLSLGQAVVAAARYQR